MINFEFFNHTRQKIPQKKLQALGRRFPEEGRVEVSFVGLRRMHILNKTYRHKDKPTDVLSFPYGEKSLLGELFICPMYNRTLAHLDLVLVHGTLHLLGHDHEASPAAAARMLARERKILGKKTLSEI